MCEGGRKKQSVQGESGKGGIQAAACEWVELEGEDRRARSAVKAANKQRIE